MARSERWSLNGREQTREVGALSVVVEDAGGVWRAWIRGERGELRVCEGTEKEAKVAAMTAEKLALDSIRWGAIEAAARIEEWATARDIELAG
jgi:hypothetical protein